MTHSEAQRQRYAAESVKYSYEHSAIVLLIEPGVYALAIPQRHTVLHIGPWAELEPAFLARPLYCPTARPSAAQRSKALAEDLLKELGL